MWEKFAKYWDDIHLVLAVSVVLDPRYKLHVIEYYATKFGSTNSDLVADKIKQCICGLVLDYQTKSEKNNSGSSTAYDSSSNPANDDHDFELFVSRRKKSKATLIHTELDRYLLEELIPKRSTEFDILMWWKLNGLKYPHFASNCKGFLGLTNHISGF
ncbi:unnamed protein product [Linum trigynum]|uniref:Uncharacterized protein n=1 Tax=Linum trigynum TaxID=586398 RepID=A0AAV2F4H9_9ROSI